MGADKLKEALRVLPALTACVLAILVGINKIIRIPILSELLRGVSFDAILLTMLALISVELLIERLDVFPRVKLVPELKKLTEEKFQETSRAIDRIQRDMSALNVIFARDLDRNFSSLAFKYISAKVTRLARDRTIQVEAHEAFALWKDCVKAATRVSAVSYAVDAWGYKRTFSSEQCQEALVREHGRSSVKRVFVFAANETAGVRNAIEEEVARQTGFCGADNILRLGIDKARQVRPMELLRQRLGLEREVNDFAHFDLGGSAWLYVTILDDDRKITAARLISDPDVCGLGFDLFEDLFILAGRTSLPAKSASL